jgi:hypothetical protein
LRIQPFFPLLDLALTPPPRNGFPWPIRFAVVDGQPTVYSLGHDGKDDGGKAESVGAPNPGDVLLRLPRSGNPKRETGP